MQKIVPTYHHPEEVNTEIKNSREDIEKRSTMVDIINKVNIIRNSKEVIQ